MIDVERHLVDDADLILANLAGDAALAVLVAQADGLDVQDLHRPDGAQGEEDQRDHADDDHLGEVDLIFVLMGA